MSERQFIGSTKVSDRWRMSLIVDLREELEEMGEDVEIGDRMLFWRRGDEIVVEPQ